MDIREYQKFLEEQLLEDGYINPHTLIFAKEECFAIRLNNPFESSESKESAISYIAEVVGERGAHKVILVSEVTYEIRGRKPDEEFNAGVAFETDDLHEAFQIIEITKFGISLILKDFKRVDKQVQLEADQPAILDNQLLFHIYKGIQDNLITLM